MRVEGQAQGPAKDLLLERALSLVHAHVRAACATRGARGLTLRLGLRPRLRLGLRLRLRLSLRLGVKAMARVRIPVRFTLGVKVRAVGRVRLRDMVRLKG